MQVTPKQNDYLHALIDGPKTTHELTQSLNTSITAARKMIRKLRDMRLVRSYGTRIYNLKQHKLTSKYYEGDIVISKPSGRGGAFKPVPDAEINYVAKLRNAGMTGQQLIDAHRRRYPNRPEKGVQHIVTKARKQGLCR